MSCHAAAYEKLGMHTNLFFQIVFGFHFFYYFFFSSKYLL